MSRLTFTKEFMEQEELGGCLYVKPELLKVWDEKLRKYENLGEPEELVKVVRCKDCKHYDDDICRKSSWFTLPDYYCFHGRKKEEPNV